MKFLLVTILSQSFSAHGDEKSPRDEMVETARRVEKEMGVELNKAREHVRKVIRHEEKVNKKVTGEEKKKQPAN